MNILGDVAKELLAMFLADARLTISILILVAIAAITVSWLHFNPLIGGASRLRYRADPCGGGRPRGQAKRIIMCNLPVLSNDRARPRRPCGATT